MSAIHPNTDNPFSSNSSKSSDFHLSTNERRMNKRMERKHNFNQRPQKRRKEQSEKSKQELERNRRRLLHQNEKDYPEEAPIVANEEIKEDLLNMEKVIGGIDFSDSFKAMASGQSLSATDSREDELRKTKEKYSRDKYMPLMDEFEMREFKKKQKEYRYETRKDASKFLKKVLDWEFLAKPHIEETPIPVNFKDYEEYFEIWEPLFERDAFAQLVNPKSEGNKTKLAGVWFTAELNYCNCKFRLFNWYFSLAKRVTNNNGMFADISLHSPKHYFIKVEPISLYNLAGEWCRESQY